MKQCIIRKKYNRVSIHFSYLTTIIIYAHSVSKVV